MLNPSANTCAQHRNPGEAICAELVLSWSYFFSLPSAFFLSVQRSISKLLKRTASMFSSGSVGNRDVRDAAGDCTASARLENALPR